MGDFTTEQIMTTASPQAARFAERVNTADPEAVFETLTRLYDATTDTVEFRGYSYDHELYLGWLTDEYGTGAVSDLTRYADTQMIRTRLVSSAAAQTQAAGILDVLSQVQGAPDRLLPRIQAALMRNHTLSKRALSEHPAGTPPGALEKSQQRVRDSWRAAQDFNMGTGDVLQLQELGQIGGFFPGDAPAELEALNDRHAPHASVLFSLAQSFGFLKTLVGPYEAAARRGHAVLHLQVYGA